jgi:threonine dehydrogenase-like Zn-dependent dehydrogenase
MKAFCLKSPGIIGYCDVPEPRLTTPWGAILKPIAVTPCTSDVHTVWGGGSPKSPNLVLGHESVGEIIEIGEYVKDFKIGDIVAVPAITPDWREVDIQNGNYGHAGTHFSGHKLGKSDPGVFAEQYLIKDADTTLAKIPDGVNIKQALMAVDVITTGFTGAEEANIKIGDTICVMGIGPIGLMSIAGAKLLGAGRIIAVGTRPVCVELAKFYGATDVISYKEGNVVEQVLAMTNERGCDATIIAGGGDEVFTQAIDMTCYGIGTISNINYFGGTGFLNFPKFSGGRGMAGKTIRTSLCRGGRARIERILEMIRYKRIDPSPLVSHELIGFDKIETALLLMKEKPSDLIKIMVKIVDW